MKLKIISTEPVGLLTRFIYDLDSVIKMIILAGMSNEDFPNFIEGLIRNEQMIGKEIEITP